MHIFKKILYYNWYAFIKYLIIYYSVHTTHTLMLKKIINDNK